MSRFAHAAALAALLATAAGPALSASRSVTNLPDGRLLSVVSDGGSLSSRSVNGQHHIVVNGTVIEFVDGKLTVDGKEREVPPFRSMLEIRIAGGDVELIPDP
jgi:Na+(H+)/acetate symporter ActP